MRRKKRDNSGIYIPVPMIWNAEKYRNKIPVNNVMQLLIPENTGENTEFCADLINGISNDTDRLLFKDGILH